jgi:hypothetical protein
MKLLDVVAKSIQDEFYKSEDSRFGVKEARAAIRATIEWLKEYENENELSFMFPAIDVLEEQLKDL